MKTKINIIDNSGIKIVYSKMGQIGDIMKARHGKVENILLLRTRLGIKRKDGLRLNFYENSGILVSEKFLPIGTRIFGLVPRELHIVGTTHLL